MMPEGISWLIMRQRGIGGWKPLVKRICFSLLSIVMVLVFIASVNFAIFRTSSQEWFLFPQVIPADSDPDILENSLREELKLDEHIVVQYFDYLANTFTGDFYTSTAVEPYADVDSFINDKALVTILLLAIVSTVSILLGMVWGSFMRKNAGKAYGKALHVLAVTSLSLPVLPLAASLAVASDNLNSGLPLSGNGFDEGVVGVLQHAILPTLSLIVAGSGFFALVTRAGLLRADRLGQKTTPFAALDYVNPFQYFLFPLVMIGVFTVDIAYGYDGLGTLVFDAKDLHDVPVLMACFFVISAIVFFSQLAFRAVRERSRFMHRIDVILGPSEGIESQTTLDLGRRSRERLSIPLLVSVLKKLARAYSRQKSGVAAALVLATILLMGLLAPPINLSDHAVSNKSASPDFQHPLGTDQFGRDLLGMNLHAAGVGIESISWTWAVSILCGLFIGFLSILSAQYSGLLSRFGSRSMAVVSVSFLAIIGPLIPICILASPYHSQAYLIEFLLILSVYCWAYRAITWPLSNSIRSVRSARRWNETGRILKGSLSSFRCSISLVLSRTLHVTKYLVVFITVFSLPFGLVSFWRLTPSTPVVSWSYLLENAYLTGAYPMGLWWMIVPPLAGIVTLAVSSYFCLDALEKVFDERAESGKALNQPGEETHSSDSDVKGGTRRS
jgi:peptide/nickel transport system permease protein